jgi:hypothetical protein
MKPEFGMTGFFFLPKLKKYGSVAEWFKAAALTAEAEGRSEHRPQIDGQTAGAVR